MPLSVNPGRTLRLVAVLVLILFAGAYLYQTTWATNRYQTDDAFIAMRIGKNIAQGIGPYFNPGSLERTNTSILHPYLLSLLFHTSDDKAIELTAWMDLATFLATVVLASAGVSSLINKRFGFNPDLTFLLTFLLLCSRINIMYGMETQLYTLLIVSVFYVATRPGLAQWAFALSCLGPFIRPDGALLAMGTLAAVVLFNGRTFNYKKHLSIGTGIALVYIAFNLIYYKTLIPHTALVKSMLFKDKWHELETYVKEILIPNSISTYLVPVSLLGLIVAFRDRAGFILAAFLVAYSAFFTAFNTWFSGYGWYRIPVQVMLDCCAALGMAWLISLFFSIVKGRKLQVAATAAVCLVCGYYCYKSLDDAQKYLTPKVVGFDRRIRVSKRIGQYLKAHVPPGQNAFLEPLGIIGFHAWPVKIKDFPGLASLEVYQCTKAYGPDSLFFYEKNVDHFFFLLNCIRDIPYTVLREREYVAIQPYINLEQALPKLTVYGIPVDKYNDTYYRIFRTDELLKARKR